MRPSMVRTSVSGSMATSLAAHILAGPYLPWPVSSPACVFPGQCLHWIFAWRAGRPSARFGVLTHGVPFIARERPRSDRPARNIPHRKCSWIEAVLDTLGITYGIISPRAATGA